MERIHSETRVFDWRSMNLFCQTNSSIASPASFRALFELNRLPIFRYIYALTGGFQGDAEDLASETVLLWR